MPKSRVDSKKVVAFTIAACAILSLVAIGIGTGYMLGWPAAVTVVGVLVWVELNLIGRAYERADRRDAQHGESADAAQ